MENSTAANFIIGHQLKQITFEWIDYALFGILLGVSALIGVYFGFFGKKQDNTTEYLMGGKTMSFFPIAMSLVASHISGVSLLSVPAEVYLYGTQYAACICTVLIANVLVAWIYLPVFYRLQLASTFEYLEIRFARPVRQFASFLCTLTAVIRTPLVIYVPALAFSQATAINLHYITPVICIVCIFYTTLGGLKAVVWADTIQIIITIGSLVAIVILGTAAVGGINEVWRIAEHGGRIILLDLDPSPFARNSFWGMSLGLMMTWTSELGTSQLSMQRFLAVPTIWEAKKAMICMAIAIIAIKWTSVFTGLAMFAKYHECDPLASKLVMKKDQILPYYVLDVAENVPGLPGLFLAGLVSASLSTMSAALNTVAGTIYEDFIEPWLPRTEKKEHNAANIMKFTVVILGLICLTLVFLMDRLGDVFSLSISLASVGAGTMLGIFSLGMLIPWANTKGAVAGGIASLLFMIFIIFGAQWNKVHQRADTKPLETSIKGCVRNVGTSTIFNQTTEDIFINSTTISSPSWLDNIIEEEEPLGIFMISFMYYTLVGACTVMIVGIVVSLICGPTDLRNVDRDHFANFVRRHIPHKEYKEVPLHAVSLKLNLQNLKNQEYKSYG